MVPQFPRFSAAAHGGRCQEYVVSIDHRPTAGGAGDVASTFDFRESTGSRCLVVVRDNVGAAKKWKAGN